MDAVIALHKPLLRRPAPHAPAHGRDAVGKARLFLRATPEALATAGSRVVVVVPDPRSLVEALGGTLAALADNGHEICVIAVSGGMADGRPPAPWFPARLHRGHPGGSEHALSALDVAASQVLHLGLPEGQVSAHEKHLAEMLPLRPDDTVFVTWRHDGPADHEACACAALAASRNVGAQCIEFPLWALVPGHPSHARLRGRLLRRIAPGSRPHEWVMA